jgi:hypothetical protein
MNNHLSIKEGAIIMKKKYFSIFLVFFIFTYVNHSCQTYSQYDANTVVIPGEKNLFKNKGTTPSWLREQPFPPWKAVLFNFDENNPMYFQYIKENEYKEAKNTILWIPLIKRVVIEGIENWIVHENHRALFENILFGLIAVETNGKFAQTGNFGHSDYQRKLGSFRGLMQMVAQKHYMEENMYDPLTAIRVGLRNIAPFVYNAGNVEAALAEHNNGKTGTVNTRIGVDAFCTIGQEFTMRVVNAAWWGHYLIYKNDVNSGKENYHNQFAENVPMEKYYDYAPPWNFLTINADNDIIIDEPDLPFNWEPPATSLAWMYVYRKLGKTFKEKSRKMIQSEIRKNVWSEDIEFQYPTNKGGQDKSICADACDNHTIVLKGISIPDWFYTEILAAHIPAVTLRPMTESEKGYYPMGAYGKTPAMKNGEHILFLENDDPLQDRVGRDRNGKWYFYTRISINAEQ